MIPLQINLLVVIIGTVFLIGLFIHHWAVNNK